MILNFNSLWSSDTDSGNDGTKPLPEPVLTSHYWGFVAFTWEQLNSAPANILYNDFENYSLL